MNFMKQVVYAHERSRQQFFGSTPAVWTEVVLIDVVYSEQLGPHYNLSLASLLFFAV